MLRRDTHINTIHYYKNVLFFLLTFSFYVILSPFHGTTHKMTIHNLFFNELPFWGIWLNSFSYFFVCCCYHHFGSFTCSLIHSFPFFLSFCLFITFILFWQQLFCCGRIRMLCVRSTHVPLYGFYACVCVCVCACVRIYVWVYVFICVFLLLIAQWINFFNFNSSGYSNIPHTRTHAHTQYKCKCNFNLFIIFYFICNFGYRLIQFAINLFIFSFVDFHPFHSN